MLQLLLGQVDPHRPRSGLGQRDGPLRRSAAELEDVQALDVAEDLQLPFGHLPHAPAGPARGGQLRSVVGLVGVAVGVPAFAVGRRVIGELVWVQPWIRHVVLPVLTNVPLSSSRQATSSSSRVFMTMGPRQAIGSRSGRPPASRKRAPPPPAWAAIDPPSPNRTSVPCPAATEVRGGTEARVSLEQIGEVRMTPRRGVRPDDVRAPGSRQGARGRWRCPAPGRQSSPHRAADHA